MAGEAPRLVGPSPPTRRRTVCVRGAALRGEATELAIPEPLSVRQLLAHYPELRRPVIHRLLREGETLNLISASKIGKSWLVTDLALATATGRRWLDTFETERGDVLIIDNELHGETSANRIPKVAAPAASRSRRSRIRCSSRTCAAGSRTSSRSAATSSR